MIRYQAPGWLPGPHLQTLWPLLRKPVLPAYQRQRWTTPDGDFIDLDHLPQPAEAPLAVLFHGLEGSSRSHYARTLMHAFAARGMHAVLPNFRGCSGEPNRLARAYHSGDSAEIDWILRRLAGTRPGRKLYVAGVSLGGNALLKWLGEQGSAATELVEAAVSICPPLDLAVSGHALARGFNRLYTNHFLTTLKRKALEKIERDVASGFDAAAIRRARTLYQFDDAFTAPAHGFRDADDYWQRASARPWLTSVAVPTLLLCCDNDPFVPAAAWPDSRTLPAAIDFERTRGGGHVGFVDGAFPGTLHWLAGRVLQHFDNAPHAAVT